MISGTCALCTKAKILQKSHIIPNSVFRKIKQDQKSGQLIWFDDSASTPVQQSQDSWWEHLLCTDCEQIISNYEKYGLALLRGTDKTKINRHADGVTFRSHDYRRFKLFLTSLLWRASVSKQMVFSKVRLPNACENQARISLHSGKPLGPLRLGCKLLRLVDATSEDRGRFSFDSLNQFVISPLLRLHDGRPYCTFLFLFEGFLMEYFVRAIPHKQAYDHGVHKDSPTFFVPHKSIFDIPELVTLMVSAYGKHDRGLATFKS
jgi:hypothetical protein